MTKLIYLANARLPTEKAHGIQIMRTCEALVAHGIEVNLVIPRRRNPIKQEPLQYYDVEQSFRITRLPTLDLVGIIPRIGFFIQSVSFAKAAVLYLLLKKTDLIYSRDELPLWFLSFFKKNLYWESHRGQYSWFVRRVLQKCKGVVVISRGLKDFYVKKGISESKILVAPDGVDLSQFELLTPNSDLSSDQSSEVSTKGEALAKAELRQQLNLPQDKFIVAYTGHLYDWKGASVLLKAAKLADTRGLSTSSNTQKHADASKLLFVFVGGTDNDIKKFKHQAKNLRLSAYPEGQDQRVSALILGHKPHSEIPKYLAAADVLVLPNSGRSEISRKFTSPIKLFEYLAAGKPIVASDLPSIREVLYPSFYPSPLAGEGRVRGKEVVGNGVLVNPDDPEALAEGIKWVLNNPEKSAKIAEQARKDVQQLTWQNRARKILDFIRKH